MKKIPKPELKSATVMSPFDMNKVPFAKVRTVLTPEQLDKIANGQPIADSASGSGLSDPIPRRSPSTTATSTGASDRVPHSGGSDPVTRLGSAGSDVGSSSISSSSTIKK